MSGRFFFKGNKALGNALQQHLTQAGFSCTETVHDADFVLSYHPLLSQLEDAYFDTNGYLASAKKGACLIDLSPATPELAREIAALCSASGLLYAEAPLAVIDITLNDAFAQPENLSCFLAGGKTDLKKAQQVLQHFVGVIRVTGEPGSAQLAHAQYTIMRAASFVSAIEAEALNRAFLRIPTLAASASAVSTKTASDLPETLVHALAQQNFAGSYTTELFMADLSAALSTAEQADISLPQAEACMSLLELLAIIGGSDMTPAALSLIYDEEEAAQNCGLDWSRAREYSEEYEQEHAHHTHHE